MPIRANARALYQGTDEPTLTGYDPAWLDNLADAAAVEGSMLDGAVPGAEAVQSIVVALIKRNKAGKTQNVVASYRPRSTLLLLSRLLREKFAGAPFAEQFAAGAP